MCSTGDAMGMNMISKGVQNILHYLEEMFPDMEVLSISGMYIDHGFLYIIILFRISRSISYFLSLSPMLFFHRQHVRRQKGHSHKLDSRPWKICGM